MGDVSGRFSGLDGQVLLEQDSQSALGVDWSGLEAVYRPSNIAKQIIDNMLPVPGWGLTDLPSTGQAVGYYILKYTENDAAFGGALGLYGSVKIISGYNMLLYYAMLILWGIFVGGYFIMIRWIKNQDIRFIMYFFGCYLILQIAISGNFDLVLALFFIQTILLLFYGLVVLLLHNVVKINAA
jgi:hypothetical protein